MKEKFLSKVARFAIVGASSFILLCCLCLLIIAIIPSDKTSTFEIETSVLPSDTVQPELIVPAGNLAQYLDTYSNYKEVFVTKMDGSIDARPNDLEELCLDWLYYRDKILEYTQAGKTDKANDARTAWNEIRYAGVRR